MKGLYYHVKQVCHFGQSRPIFSRLGGKIITPANYPISFLHFLFRYGPMKSKIMEKKLGRLDRVARGLILCHSAANVVPKGGNYRRVFVYHGTSDKVFTTPGGKLEADWYDYYFLTGNKDLYKLRNYLRNPERLEGKIVKIGMFRSDPLFNGSYDRGDLLKKYGIKPEGRRIILYAPTWKWGGGTLDRCFARFVQEIPKKYVFVIRPHYNDRKKIKEILKFQASNRIKHFYVFAKQHQEIMDLICISDLMIGDNSAVNYEFALTKRPMVFVKSEAKEVFTPPDEYNVKLCGPAYDPDKDDILPKVEEAFESDEYNGCMERLVERSYYFNDGHAVDRACSFIVDTLGEMGIIDRAETLKKYRGVFTYRGEYV
jgi:CDP-glycerol glycerophosphotransferase (TagB/SpsB family)